MATFYLFNSFPPEIHSLILEACPNNDAICLRLTNKYFYTMSPSSKPNLSLENDDNTRNLCDVNSSLPYNRYLHRHQCHRQSYDNLCKTRNVEFLPTPQLKRCTTQRWSDHCECFTRRNKLHTRIRQWMPKKLKYCGECKKFTKRKKSHNGRCFHGRRRQPRRTETFWTHRSRNGAFGYKLWKKWFNNNAMNHFESSLREGRDRTSSRYHFRKLEPKPVDTRMSRGWDGH